MAENLHQFTAVNDEGEKMKKLFFISLLFIFWFILVPWALLVFEMNKRLKVGQTCSSQCDNI